MSTAFVHQLYRPPLYDIQYQYLQGLSCSDSSLFLGTNHGKLLEMKKNEYGHLELTNIKKISTRNILKINNCGNQMIIHCDTENMNSNPFGKSVIVACKSINHILTVSHIKSRLIYDEVSNDFQYKAFYMNGDIHIYSLFGKKDIIETKIGNLRIGEMIQMVCSSDDKTYVMTSHSRFGVLDSSTDFIEMHDFSLMGMCTAMYVKHAREDVIFVYVGTSTGRVFFLQFNGIEPVVRNHIQISSDSLQRHSPVTQISSNQGQTIYASTLCGKIVGFNMISFDIVFEVSTNYDSFQFNNDNFVVNRNSLITYHNKKELVCFIL
jgi:hypothetical protein